MKPFRTDDVHGLGEHADRRTGTSSLLCASAGQRLALASGCIALVWIATLWALT